MNIASLLNSKVARIIALKRGILGTLLRLNPLLLLRPRPIPFKPSFTPVRPSYNPPNQINNNPPRPSYGAPVQITTPAPNPSYRAPGYYDPPIPNDDSEYHTNVDAVIQVADDSRPNGRFPNGKQNIC